MGKLFDELKRRKVFRAATVYAVVAWLLIQVADVVLPTFGAPAWVNQVVILTLFLGFPIAIVLAWALELSPDGIKLDPVATKEDLATSANSKNRIWVVGVTAFVISLVSGTAYLTYKTPPVSNSEVPTLEIEKSIAVLPFVAMSSGEDDGYFADGLTEELLNSLAQLDDLKVAARTSSFYYKGKDQDLRQIGTELGVAHILEGSVRRAGDRIRITAQLIEAQGGFHLWSANYDRSMSDIFFIQDDISREVTNALRIELLGEELEALEQHGTDNPEAQNLYLIATARFRELAFRPGGLQSDPLPAGRMRALFEEATRIDPGYADAWAGLSQAIMLLGRNGLTENTGTLLTTTDGIEQAQVALDRAVALAPNAESTLLAVAEMTYRRYQSAELGSTSEGDIEEVYGAFERVLDTAPDNVLALESLAQIYNEQGEYEKALELWDRIIELDPLSPTRQNQAIALFYSSPVEAIRQAKRVGDLYPDSNWQGFIAFSETQLGHLHHAILWWQQTQNITDGNTNLWPLEIASMSLGDDEAAFASMERGASRAGGTLGEVIDRYAAVYRQEYEEVVSRELQIQDETTNGRPFQALIPSLFRLRQFDEVLAQADAFYANLEAGDIETRLNGEIRDPRPFYELTYAYQMTGDEERARLLRDTLRQKVHSRFDPQNWRDSMRLHEGELMLLASEGRVEEALDEFEALVEEGWRLLVAPNITSNGQLLSLFLYRFEDNPILDSLQDHPRFIETLNFVKAENAAMLAELNTGLSFEDIVAEY